MFICYHFSHQQEPQKTVWSDKCYLHFLWVPGRYFGSRPHTCKDINWRRSYIDRQLELNVRQPIILWQDRADGTMNRAMQSDSVFCHYCQPTANVEQRPLIGRERKSVGRFGMAIL